MKSILKKMFLIGILSFVFAGLFFEVEAKATGTEPAFTSVIINGPCSHSNGVTTCKSARCTDDGSLCPVTLDFNPMLNGAGSFIMQVNSETHGKLRAQITPDWSKYHFAFELNTEPRHFAFDSGEGSIVTLDGFGSDGTSKNNKRIDHVASVCHYEVAFNSDGTTNGVPIDYLQSIYYFE